MKILYIIYQVCFALPILLVLTILTALVTIIGSLIGGAHIWGYYPGKIWSQLICYILLIPVEVFLSFPVSVWHIDSLILCNNTRIFYSVLRLFFVRSAKICIHSLCVLKVKLGI